MPLYDQYGQIISTSKLAEAAVQFSDRRAPEPVSLSSIDQLIPSYDLQVLICAARRLYINLDVPRAAVKQKASYSVGGAWRPCFCGENKEWGKEVADWLTTVYLPNMNTRGEAFDWHTSLECASTSIDIEAGFLLIRVEKDGWPMILTIPSWRMTDGETDGGIIKDGDFRGFKVQNGVIRDKLSTPVGFRYMLGDDSLTEVVDVPVKSAVHYYDPEFFDSYRGVPAFISSLNSLKDAKTSHEWELLAQKALSSISLIEYNDLGGPDPDDPKNYLSGVADGKISVATETLEGGVVRYFKSNSGGRVETIKNDRPGDMWDRFQDRVNRGALTAIDWPYSFVWKFEGVNGTAQRQEIQKARKSVVRRQRLLSRFALHSVNWGVAYAIEKLRLFPAVDDWFKWSFTLPSQIEVDEGHESKAFVSEWEVGTANHTERVSRKGRSLEEHYRERAREVLLRKRIAKEESEADGEFEVTDEEMSISTRPPAPEPQEEEPNTPPKDEPPTV